MRYGGTYELPPKPRLRPRKPSRAERDERIVAEAGPWRVGTAFKAIGVVYGAMSAPQDAKAAARILNRLRKRRKK